MSPSEFSLITFVIVFGGALAGMRVRTILPQDHLTDASKDSVKVGMGLIATMAALVLSLLIASAKSFMDTQSTELTHLSTQAIFLDRILDHYGPDAEEARHILRGAVSTTLDLMTSAGDPVASNHVGEPLYEAIQRLTPKDDSQRSMRDQALGITMELGKMRWLMSEQKVTGVPIPLVVVLISWLTIIFIGFGLFAPTNATVIASLLVSALSVSGAILLILEMFAPFGGIIRVSSAPLSYALSQLGR